MVLSDSSYWWLISMYAMIIIIYQLYVSLVKSDLPGNEMFLFILKF